MTRNINFPSILLAMALLFPGGSAYAAPIVEEYLQNTVNHGVAILNDKSLSASKRQVAVREFLSSNIDIKRIAIFALGSAAPVTPTPETESYLKAFEALTLNFYSSMIDGYGGQTVKITGSSERAPGDFILSADVIDPSAPRSEQAGHVRFRVLAEGEKFAVVDASVEGVWFELAQRDSVQGYLGANGRDVTKLTDHLNKMAAQMALPH
jgi:phospholipid transport system substrate-binding protein